MSCRPSSPNQCLQLWPKIRRADEIKKSFESIEDHIQDKWLTRTRALTRFQYVVFLPSWLSSTSQHRILLDQLLPVVHQEKLTRCANN